MVCCESSSIKKSSQRKFAFFIRPGRVVDARAARPRYSKSLTIFSQSISRRIRQLELIVRLNQTTMQRLRVPTGRIEICWCRQVVIRLNRCLANINSNKLHQLLTATIKRWLRVYRPEVISCLLYTSPSPRDRTRSRMPSSA